MNPKKERYGGPETAIMNLNFTVEKTIDRIAHLQTSNESNNSSFDKPRIKNKLELLRMHVKLISKYKVSVPKVCDTGSSTSMRTVR